MCPGVVRVEILGPFAWQEEEEANRKFPCLLGDVFQNCFVKYALHIHLATEKKEVVHSPIPVVKITSRFIPCPCAKHTPDTNPTAAHPYSFMGTHVPTRGGIPSVALNNL